jgi:hypothetical protein
MKPADVFGIVVRVLGLSMTLYFLWSLVTNIALSVSVPGMPGMEGITAWFVVTALVGIVVGAYFLRGAPQLLRFSYPNGR